MKLIRKRASLLVLVGCLFVLGMALAPQAGAFTPFKGNMNTFDPHHQKIPKGDTIKVGFFWQLSGPSAINGKLFWCTIGWVVHDINSQGGIWVDGRKKLIQLVPGDHQAKPSMAMRVATRLCVQDKVDVIIGTSGTPFNLIGQKVAAKYKKVYLNVASLSTMLMNKKNFNRYTFRTVATTELYGRALARFYVGRPEKRFYILCQDYSYGHAFANAFKKALKKFRPDAKIVGEDYHKLWLKDFAPYLAKVKGARAQVIVTGDWSPDIDNMEKQSRQLGMRTPCAGPFVASPLPLTAIGGPAGVGMVPVATFSNDEANKARMIFTMLWNKQWKRWKKPLYNSNLFKWPAGILAHSTLAAYWFFDVMQRAKTVNPEKIIKIFEGDTYTVAGHTFHMRKCDHQGIQNMYIFPTVFPNPWFKKCAAAKKVYTIDKKWLIPIAPKALCP
jgi:ABC-type branched-subunit amino acid transport system substrate-binding protein